MIRTCSRWPLAAEEATMLDMERAQFQLEKLLGDQPDLSHLAVRRRGKPWLSTADRPKTARTTLVSPSSTDMGDSGA